MSSQKQFGPGLRTAKPEYCDLCRKVHAGGFDICPKVKTDKDLGAFLDEIKSSGATESWEGFQDEPAQSGGGVQDVVVPEEKDENDITLNKHLSCSRFAEAGGFFGGPTVIIYMGPEATKRKYMLTKTLLCSVSAFFKTQFEDNLEEGQDQILHMDEDDAENLELFIQWLYTDTVVLNPRKAASDSAQDKLKFQQDTIARWLDFVMFCHKLLLPGICGEVITQMRASLSENRQALQPGHVRTAITLPDGHAVRQLFADAAVVEYMDAQTRIGGQFWLSKEVEELKEFAADLLVACGALWASGGIPKKSHFDWVDPLTKKNCRVDSSSYGKIQLGSSLPRPS